MYNSLKSSDFAHGRCWNIYRITFSLRYISSCTLLFALLLPALCSDHAPVSRMRTPQTWIRWHLIVNIFFLVITFFLFMCFVESLTTYMFCFLGTIRDKKLCNSTKEDYEENGAFTSNIANIYVFRDYIFHSLWKESLTFHALKRKSCGWWERPNLIVRKY